MCEDEAEVMIGSLDEAPTDLVPEYELWVARREAWLPPLPNAAQFEGDREPPGRSQGRVPERLTGRLNPDLPSLDDDGAEACLWASVTCGALFMPSSYTQWVNNLSRLLAPDLGLGGVNRLLERWQRRGVRNADTAWNASSLTKIEPISCCSASTSMLKSPGCAFMQLLLASRVGSNGYRSLDTGQRHGLFASGDQHGARSY